MFLFKENALHDDIRVVLDAVSLLDTTEFHLFENAYQNWFGRKADQKYLDGIFAQYMFQNIVPMWVREYARKVLRLHSQGFTMQQDGKHNTPNKRQKWKGFALLIGIAFILMVLLVSAEISVHLFNILQECYFPPCY